MEKMMKMAQRLDTFVRVVFWVMVAAGSLVVGAVIVMAVTGDAESLAQMHTTNVGPAVMLQYADEPTSFYYRSLGHVSHMSMFTMLALDISQLAVGFVVAFLGTHFVRGILKPMKEGQPFAHEVAVNLRKLGWLSLIGGFVLQAEQFIWQKITFSAFDLISLFDPEKVVGVTVNWRIDLTFLLVALILELLSFVFRYGEELQQQSDETL